MRRQPRERPFFSLNDYRGTFLDGLNNATPADIYHSFCKYRRSNGKIIVEKSTISAGWWRWDFWHFYLYVTHEGILIENEWTAELVAIKHGEWKHVRNCTYIHIYMVPSSRRRIFFKFFTRHRSILNPSSRKWTNNITKYTTHETLI